MEELVVEFKPGQLIFQEGESSKDLYIIQEGVVRVYKEDLKGGVWPLAMLHAGQFIGEMSFFDGKPRSASAQAATAVRALKLEAPKLEKEIRKLPPWVITMVRSLADRVRYVNELIKRNNIMDDRLQEEFARWDNIPMTPPASEKKS